MRNRRGEPPPPSLRPRFVPQADLATAKDFRRRARLGSREAGVQAAAAVRAGQACRRALVSSGLDGLSPCGTGFRREWAAAPPADTARCRGKAASLGVGRCRVQDDTVGYGEHVLDRQQLVAMQAG